MKYPIQSKLPSMNLFAQTIFLRTDLNVPLSDGTIINDHKLQASCATIDFLLKKNAFITLATHLGRPKNKAPEFSTKQLIPWFKNKGYAIDFAETPKQAAEKINKKIPGTIIFLENLRFFPGEQHHDETFARELAHCGSIYVNDAFGAIARTDTSLTLLPQLYPPQAKTVGLLVEKELDALNKLIDKPKKPFVVILGGAKIATKLPFLQAISNKVDTILLCPALVFTLMKALSIPVGKSLVDDSLLDQTKNLFRETKDKALFFLPKDFQIAQNSIDGILSYTESQSIPENDVGIAIGPKTLQEYTHIIKNAGTVFFNGPMGFLDRPETMQATCSLMQAMATSTAYTVIGGGDAVASAHFCKTAESINFLSTGGGATLAYLSGQQLPALENILK